MITENTLYSTISKIENSTDVSKLNYKGLDVWPIIRSSLRVSYIEYLNKSKINGTPKKSKPNFIKHFYSILGVIKLVLLFPRNSILLFTDDEYHSDKLNSTKYDRHSDPFFELALKEKYKAQKISYTHYKESQNDVDYHYKPYLLNINFINLLARKFTGPILLDENLKSIINTIEKDSGLSIYNNVIFFLNVVTACTKFYYWLLRIKNPKIVFTVCYYSPQCMSIINASRKLNIPSVDIQHGKQGDLHIMYANWTKTPTEGFNLVPDYFWVWGEQSAKKLDIAFGNIPNRHNTVIGGNLWAQKWKLNPPEIDDNRWDLLCTKMEKYKDVYLISLQQNIDNPVPDYLLEAVARHSDVLWCFRLHPKQGNVNKIKDILETSKLKNIDLDLSTAVPLYPLFGKVSLHFTCWSSVCIEALQFGIHSVIIHENGLQIFDKEISEKLFFAGTSIEEIEIGIEAINSLDFNNEINSYFLSDPEKTKLKFKELVSKSEKR